MQKRHLLVANKPDRPMASKQPILEAEYGPKCIEGLENVMRHTCEHVHPAQHFQRKQVRRPMVKQFAEIMYR